MSVVRYDAEGGGFGHEEHLASCGRGDGLGDARKTAHTVMDAQEDNYRAENAQGRQN